MGAPLTTNHSILQFSGQVKLAVPAFAEYISLYTRVPSFFNATNPYLHPADETFIALYPAAPAIPSKFAVMIVPASGTFNLMTLYP